MSSDIVVKVSNLGKCYHIYARPHDRLKQSFWRGRKNFFKEFWALKDVSFELKKGETLGIVGRNGSGKSTLLQMLSGTLTPTSGDIEINGRVSSLLELGAGFNGEFTGRENVFLNGAVLGFSRKEMEAKFDEIASFADIGMFMDQPVKTYSTGMYVRLAFSVAINVDPDILIIDEALAVGDVNFQAKCMNKFDSFRKAGKTILLVSHDVGAILQFSSKVLVLDNGSILEIGDPKEAVDAYKKLMVGLLVKDKQKVEAERSLRVRQLAEQPWCSHFEISSVCNIYGNHKATIVDIGIFDMKNLPCQKLISGERYSFKMRVQFNAKVENPIFTTTVRDMVGKEITGTNTWYQNLLTGIFEPEEEVIISFVQEVNLNTGNYLLTFACSGYDNENFVVYERLYHIFLIEVSCFKRIVGYFDFDSQIEIQRVGSPKIVNET